MAFASSAPRKKDITVMKPSAKKTRTARRILVSMESASSVLTWPRVVTVAVTVVTRIPTVFPTPV